jgi:hypothetical protein
MLASQPFNGFGWKSLIGKTGSRPSIRCTADPAKADKRTRSKWSRALRYAAAHKPDSEPLDRLIRRKGGINACAGRFFRYAGRIKPTRRDSAHSIITPQF